MENAKEKTDHPREAKTAPTISSLIVVFRAGIKIYNKRKNPVKKNSEKNPRRFTNITAIGANRGKCRFT